MTAQPIEPLGEADLAALVHFVETQTESDGRFEIIGGEIVVTPPPKPRHQVMANDIARLLIRAVPDDWSVEPELPVQLAGEYVVPDISVYDHAPIPGDEQYLDDLPRLVVEVESANNLRRDRIEKTAIYAKAGVDAYWRVERDGAAHLHLGPRPEDGTWHVVHSVRPGESFAVVEPFEIDVRPASWLRWEW